MPVLAKKPKTSIATPKRKPLWEGPNGSGPLGGITYSMLSRFLCCRERFRLYAVEGWKEPGGFSYRMDYGSMLHACMEATAGNKPWEPSLKAYCEKLVAKHGAQDSGAIEHWRRVALVQYPVYLAHWKKHKDVVKRKPIYQEKVFDVPYTLPSGRVVRLRGKFDSVDEIGRAGIYLQENKAKGDVEPEKMLANLPFDFQTNMYMTALSLDLKKPLAGVRYNVIRRPLSGGKHSIKQKQGQSEDAFYAELGERIAGDCEYFFFRWKVEFLPGDIERFQQRTLNPILEQLWDWWEYISVDPFDPWRPRRMDERYPDPKDAPQSENNYRYSYQHVDNRVHFLYPTGVWNPTLEGRSSVYDNLLLTGSDRGLERADTLFTELTE